MSRGCRRRCRVRSTLGEIVRSHSDWNARREAVRAYAADVGRSLSGLGINLNFAPVVDLDHGVSNPNDRYTRIGARAISSDPKIVADVAGEYCRGLARHGVHCTIKHFPGLGRVFEDTHLEHATLATPAEELTKSDWLPFKDLMQQKSMFTMLAHVRLAAIDRDRPASVSVPVVSGLLRGDWKYDGILVTDDFSMRAAYRSDGGLARASISALNAGVDLILISYDPDQYFPVVHALLRAQAQGGSAKGALAGEALDRSNRRLSGVMRRAEGCRFGPLVARVLCSGRKSLLIQAYRATHGAGGEGRPGRRGGREFGLFLGALRRP